MAQTFRLTVLAIGLLSSTGLIGASQTPADAQRAVGGAPTTQRPAPDPPRFRVGVDVVRIDAVVTDKDGRVVSDLTPADFELRQDGDIQPVTLAQFVPVATSSDPGVQHAGAFRARPVVPAIDRPPTSPRPLSRHEVQRSIALVVDDLSLSVESFAPTQRALHKFIDTDLQPHDLVALVRTSSPGGMLQPFTADRRLLHAQIDALRWSLNSRNGVEPFSPIQGSMITVGMPAHGAGMGEQDFKLVEDLRRQMSASGTLGALNLLLRGARDLPGRRAMVLLSEGFEIMRTDHGVWMPETRVRGALDRVIEQATRAGVVIYGVDARGLQTGGLLASDNTVSSQEQSIAQKSLERARFLVDTQEGMSYLAEQTGGFAVLNTNDLAAGIRRATDDVRSYYVVGFTPAEGTFAKEGKTPRLHKISLKAKRPGLKVRTRKTFFGVSDPDVPLAPPTPAEALRGAVMSPFATTEIPLKATTLPAYSPAAGTFVRALLHIDGSVLSFTPGADGRRTADVDVLGMAFDQEGQEVGHLSTGFSLALTDHADQQSLEDGVVYVLRVPIPRPGAYQVRFAVRDRHTGALGSVGEFVQLDDIARGEFALSGIVIGENAAAADAKPAEGLDTAGLLRQQARRVFGAGTNLSFAYEVYNASAPVEASASVWSGERKVFAGAPDTLTPPKEAGPRFAAAGGLKLGDKLPPGEYVLQVVARTRDPQDKGKAHSATQRVQFEVR
jgi:VWFA-related protein